MRSLETGSIDRSVEQQSHYLLQPLKHKVNCVRARWSGSVPPEVRGVTPLDRLRRVETSPRTIC